MEPKETKQNHLVSPFPQPIGTLDQVFLSLLDML